MQAEPELRLTDLVLYIDDREKHVTQHAHLLAGITYKITRMTVGDYAICYKDSIIAAFERKSLEDLSASCKDGRYDNKSKLIDLRQKTGCTVYFLIEGWAPKKAAKPVGGIPWGYLESACDHMAIRDRFQFLYTRDAVDTANRLQRFVRSMQSLVNKGELECNDEPNVELLAAKQEVHDDDIVRMMWSVFPGVAVTTADAFMKRFTLHEVVKGKADIENTTMSDGRAVNKRVILNMKKIDKKQQIKLLSCVPGVSTATATELLRERNLGQILSYDAGAISMCKVGKPEKNFGDKRAANVKKYFDYSTKPVPVVPVAVPIVHVAVPILAGLQLDRTPITVPTIDNLPDFLL